MNQAEAEAKNAVREMRRMVGWLKVLGAMAGPVLSREIKRKIGRLTEQAIRLEAAWRRAK